MIGNWKEDINEPLYCYKIGDDGVINKYVITSYYKTDRSRFWGGWVIRFKGRLGTNDKRVHDLTNEHIDRLCSGKYYTFHDSDEEAYKRIIAELTDKVSSAQASLDRAKARLDLVKQANFSEDSDGNSIEK